MKRTICEVFSRSMGYIRPVGNFNIGKKAEFDERKTFKENVIFSKIKNFFKQQKECTMPCGKKKGGKK